MANENNIGGLISTTNSQILAAGLNIPDGFNNSRSTGELEILYKPNATAIYNKFAFKTVPKNQRPLIESSIGKTRSNFGMATNDLVRITKWSMSRPGISFLTTQLLMQGLNAFNETKLYNPLMPIVAAASKASFGLVQSPQRFIEPSLGGLLGATGLGGIASIFGLNSSPKPPKGTVGEVGLPTIVNGGSAGGKGLLRGKTATDANKKFNDYWAASSGKGGFFSNLLKSVGGFLQANTAIGTFFPVGQPDGTTYKVGDKSYGSFLRSKSKLFTTNHYTNGSYVTDEDDGRLRWIAGKGLTDGDNTNMYKMRVINNTSTSNSNEFLINTESGHKLNSKDVKLTIKKSDNGGLKYSDSVGIDAIKKNGGDYTAYDNSDAIINYSYFNKFDYKSKFTDPLSDDAKEVNKNLQQVLDTIGKVYDVSNVTKDTNINKIMSNPKSKSIGYDVLNVKNQGENPQKYTDQFQNILKSTVGINDSIPFYFHDIVNDKYIPFRATLKGLNESLSSDWNEIKYINRADKLYSYGGFTRTLNFNFQVVITSVKELLPTWKKINYFVGLVKPANYTDGTIYSRFIVPPLIKFTIGDIYKYQPAVITQIQMTIPDNASWELLSEDYSKDNDWSYNNNNIVWQLSKNKYAQFPNECDISVTMNLFEKELPHTGGSNYGDYYLDNEMNLEKGKSKKTSFSGQLYYDNVDVPQLNLKSKVETKPIEPQPSLQEEIDRAMGVQKSTGPAGGPNLLNPTEEVLQNMKNSINNPSFKVEIIGP